MYRIALAAALIFSSAAVAQDMAPDTDDASPFPDELILLPEDVQQAAQSGLEAEAAEVPSGMNAGEEAWYRAQVAYVGGDFFLARRFAENAAVSGIVDAATLSGIMARDGQGGARDVAEAARWFRRGADAEDPVALYQLGLLARLGDESLGLGSSRSWFERAARAGHIEAMVAYALALRSSPIPQDAIAAREWAERAAQQDSAEGMYQLAQLLDEGLGGDRDADAARIWYERAAEANLAEGAFQAGMMWADGEGGPQDDVEARRWLRIAAESNYAPAQGQYGLMLYQGRGGEGDAVEAAHWFGQGARRGDAESQYLYAFVLAQGEGVTRNLEDAYGWVLLAANDALGAPVHNRDRDRLQAALERALPLDRQAEIRDRLGLD